MEERKSLYLESSIISYYTARPSNDPIIRGHQEATKQWWEKHRNDFDLYLSEFVMGEINRGDEGAAKERRAVIKNIPILEIEEIEEKIYDLADKLTQKGELPLKARVDAFHISIASIKEMDYLLTWNCKHIANAVLLPKIRKVIENQGYVFPLICTPDQLLGV